jgi:hypothetical protein
VEKLESDKVIGSDNAETYDTKLPYESISVIGSDTDSK